MTETYRNRLTGENVTLTGKTELSAILKNTNNREFTVDWATFGTRYELVPKTKRVKKIVWRCPITGETFLGEKDYQEDEKFGANDVGGYYVSTIMVEIPA